MGKSGGLEDVDWGFGVDCSILARLVGCLNIIVELVELVEFERFSHDSRAAFIVKRRARNQGLLVPRLVHGTLGST